MAANLSRSEQYEFNKLRKRLRRLTAKAIEDFGMIGEGDRVMVCLSGGADSHTLLDILLGLRNSAPVKFDLVAVNLDQKQPGFPAQVLPDYLTDLGIEYHVIEQDTFGIVQRVVPEGKTYCGLCSRLRRGILYRFAWENGFSRIALGHHREDIIETLFLNMFFGGKLKAMPPKLLSDDGRNVLIRPLAYCREADIKHYAMLREFPIIPCSLCGSQQNLKRREIKQMLKQWERTCPGRVETIFASLQNAVPSHLMDASLWDFAALDRHQESRFDAQKRG